MTMIELGTRAKTAARSLAIAPTTQKNRALHCMAETLLASSSEILEANLQDLAEARNAGLSPAMLDRLMLNNTRLQDIAADLAAVAGLPDPVGEVFEEQMMPNKLQVHKQRVPLGVLGVIYEARPNVTVDVSGLALKSGNAAILRGGSETIRSNRALVTVIQRALGESSLPVDAVQFIDDPDRRHVLEMLQAADMIDLIIPRGGAGLHQFCRDNSRIPVMTGGIGICHLFVDESADLEACLPLIENAKIQRPTVCNALDTVLIHRHIAQGFLPRLVQRLYADGVTFRADSSAQPFIQGLPGVSPAGPEDFDTEWLSLVLGLKVVDGLDEAIEHIQVHSTAHSDGILTQEADNARRFVSLVDSAAVYVNASTRFTDGSQLGLGAEVAISTQRLHARGPMALRELTTYKWVIQGEYHIRP
jgi:glutamate-5-semialdehyde dehydrogenase